MKKLLLMDDDEAIRSVMTKLMAIRGYTLETAPDGDETLEKYEAALTTEKPFDAVILDFTIVDGMNGKDTMIELCKLDSKVIGILATGNAQSHEALKYKEHGFKDLISKPYTVDELEKILKKHLHFNG